MKKFLILALGAAIMTFPSLKANAQDTLIIDDGSDSVLEGTVHDIRFKEVVVEVDGKEILVDIGNLNIDNEADEYFPIGTRVQVIGQLTDSDEMNARKMIKLDPIPAAAPEVQVITE